MANTYTVVAEMTTQLEIIVIADSEEEALKKAKSIDGGDFTEIEGSGDWRIQSATLLDSDVKAEEVDEKDILFAYYQPTNNKLLLGDFSSSSVWFSQAECKDDNDTDDIATYSGVDIEAPFFEDLNSFHTTKFIIEALMKQSALFVDGTDAGMDYAFCIIDSSEVDWCSVKDYTLEQHSSRIEKDDAVCDLESLMDYMASCRSAEQPLGAVYWNYN